jgi:excinuclease ABC subunit A
VIGVDYGLVIPNDKLTLRAGAIKPIQTPAWKECQDDLMRHAEAAGIPRDTPWNKLTPEQQGWVINGSPNWNGKWNQQWYGIKRFFEYLESKAYKMHIRVLLSKYRSYTPCPPAAARASRPRACCGASAARPMPTPVLEPGKALHARRGAMDARPAGGPAGPVPARPDAAAAGPPAPLLRVDDPGAQRRGQRGRNASKLKLLHEEITTRLKYLCDVGIGYLTLDRQSRTLSGGEVQRINLTTALGTSLVNTLFVLDEPSIGLHPRDMHRITEGHAAPARRRQHAGGGGARPGRDAGGRPHDRHGPRPGRARRADRVRRHDRGAAQRRHADRRLPGRPQAGRLWLQAHGDRPHAAPHP